MSESEQSGAGRREVAYRLFASEFDDADFSYSESDEERAPNYVITPTGARVNRLFVVGVLTEVEEVSEDVLRGRVVDPTGAFVLYAGQYQPDEQAFLDSAHTPMFVAVTGKARTFQPDDSEQVFTSIRPESISEVDAATRDRWTVQTAEQTIERVGHMATARSLDVRGDDLRDVLEGHGVDDGLAAGIPLALDHYGTTGAYLTALRDLAIDATRLVADDLDEVEPLSLAPDEGGHGDLSALAEADVDVSTSATALGDTDSADTTSSTEAETAAEPETEPEVVSDTGVASPSESTATSEPDGSASGSTAESATEATTSESSTTIAETPEEEPEPVEATATTAGAETSESTTAGTDVAPATEPSTETTPDSDSDDDEDIGDFEPGEFELDEAEREEIEEEYGTEFQSGTDVPDPGESDIETPDPEELAEEPQDGEAVEDSPAADGTDSTETESESETPPVSEEEAEPVDETDESAESVEDVDLEDAAVETMEALDDGDGADRATLVETLAERYDVSAEDAEDAIQDALMGGRCYEPNDTTVKPI